ncbi:hypothetical protein NUBL21984_50870 [Klebsiella pneumoniae]|nr:hypothetical protein NUBL21984_50870 [Klebsiella pneumoniae]
MGELVVNGMLSNTRTAVEASGPFRIEALQATLTHFKEVEICNRSSSPIDSFAISVVYVCPLISYARYFNSFLAAQKRAL